MIDAVRVPPSAWMTSQSIQTVRSPSSAQSHDGAHRSADQALNLHRAAADFALRRFARRARRRRARQHAVLGRHPALAAAAQKRRHAIFDAGRADDARASDFDQHRAFGVQEEVWRDRGRTQFVGRAIVLSSH